MGGCIGTPEGGNEMGEGTEEGEVGEREKEGALIRLVYDLPT